MSKFITLQCADDEEVVLHLDEIAMVKSWDVSTKRKGGKLVPGCIVERRTSEFAVWCIQPKDEVLGMMEHAGADITRNSR
jgi:hypothetical protein